MMKKKNLFYSAHFSSGKDFIPHSWDCETLGLGGELLCITSCAVSPDCVQFYSSQIIESFLSEAFLYPYSKHCRHLWISHNMSYDLRYIIAYVLAHKDSYKIGDIGMRTDSLMYMCEVVRKSDGALIRFADSFAFFPKSLEDFASQFGGEYQKLNGPDWETEVFNPESVEHIKYAKGDASALYQSIINYQATVREDYDVALGYTAAGTALKGWQKTIPGGTAYFKPSRLCNDFYREAYYGGLVFMTGTDTIVDAVTVDINSSYPAQMLGGVPSGKGSWTVEPPESALIGFYRCEIECPDNLVIPCIPSRTEKGDLFWPLSGGFTGVLSVPEIFFARSVGYKIVTGKGCVFLDGLDFPFGDFICSCEKIRAKNKDLPREEAAKLMQNSLYGKFGTKESRTEVVYLDPDDFTVEAYLEAIEGKKPLYDGIPDMGFFVSCVDDEDMKCKPEWAAWITAQGRLALLRVAYGVGVKHVLYGDTDSLTLRPSCDINKIDIGDKYGQFKVEKRWEKFRAIAPKCYAGIIKGVHKGKSKGQRSKSMLEDNWNELLLYGTTEIDTLQLEGILQSMKKGVVSPAKAMKKKSSDLRKSRSYKSLAGEN